MSILNGNWWSFFCFSTIIEWISLVPPHGLVGVSKTWFKSGLTFKGELNEYEFNSIIFRTFWIRPIYRQKNILENGRIFLNLFFACFSSNFGLKKFIKTLWFLKPSFSESKFSKISYDCSIMCLLFLKGLFAHR